MTRQVKVIKIPLSPQYKNRDRPKAFPRMPRLYLELFENKAKIKPDLVNKEYVPPAYNLEVVNDKPSSPPVRENYSAHSSPAASPPSQPPLSLQRSGFREQFRQQFEQAKNREINRLKEKAVEAYKSNKTEVKEKESISSSESSHSSPESPESRSSSASSSNELSGRLKELLQSDSDHGSPDSDKYESYQKDRHSRGGNVPPSLAELEQQGHVTMRKELRDLGQSNMSEQEEEDAKRELLFKFELLKKSYKSANIPEFSIHSDYNTMKRTYEMTLKTLTLDSSVESYKTYLIGGFMITEFILGNWLGFDMQGFTQQQIISMASYEKLLIELGEKSYVPTGSKWPVELRLVFLIIINAALFIVSKMIMKKTGANVINMINSMNSASTSVPTQAMPKRKMKGPDIDLNDIPEAS